MAALLLHALEGRVLLAVEAGLGEETAMAIDKLVSLRLIPCVLSL